MLDIRYRTILSVALPLMISTFIQSIVLITDASFISRYNTHAFDAVGNGGLLYITMYMALLGMSDGAQIIIARRIGQYKYKSISKIFGTTLFILTIIAVFLFVILYYFMPDWVMSYSKNAEIAIYQGQYIQIRSFALFSAIITLSIQAFFLAIGKTWVVLIASLITALSNIFLDYALIFGNLSFPEMGLEGAAWASTIADIMGMVFLLLFTLFTRFKNEYHLFHSLKISMYSFKEMLKIGTPLMLQGLTALATWTVFLHGLSNLDHLNLPFHKIFEPYICLHLCLFGGLPEPLKPTFHNIWGEKSFI